MTKVSIIIPNYNNEQWLSACLQSCIDQVFLKEIIVVDDHSTDQSWQLLEQWKREHPQIISIFKNPEKGGNQARNYGYTQASGQYIQWLDSDDRLLPGKLKAQVGYLETHPESDIIYSDWQMDYFLEGKYNRTEHVNYGPFDNFLYELIRDNWTVPCNYLLRKPFADRLANGVGWNPGTKVGQDREYFTKAAIIGAKFDYVPGTFAVYNRWSSNTVSRMPFEERLVEIYKLECVFRELIQAKTEIRNKSKLLKCLNGQALKAKYYHPELQLKNKLIWKDIDWTEFPWKLRILILVRWLIGR